MHAPVALRMAAVRLLLVAAMIGSSATAMFAQDAERGQLLVLVRPEAPLGARFVSTHLPALQELATNLEVPLQVVDVSQAAPQEVALTPLIVFQNHRGRSIFQGRFTDLGRVRSFVQTSRFAPQQNVPFTREDTPLLRQGRMQIATPIKIVPLTGTQPAAHDSIAFLQESMHALCAGFESLQRQPRIALGRSDRLFYMDVYPWRSEQDSLFLTLALFSQFHCKEPVYVSPNPIVGAWDERQAVWARAARALEAAMFEEMANDARGDGFDAMPSAVAAASWGELGLALPPAPAKQDIDTGGFELVQRWQLDVDGSSGQEPAIQFRFPAPIDHYRGMVTRVTGNLQLGDDLSLDTASGWVEADVTSTTMGTADLDEAIQGRTFLRAPEHPRARFALQRMQSQGAGLGFGQLSQVALTGTFNLRGVDMPLEMVAQLEPVVTADRQVRLLVKGEFTINLRRPFGMLAADGPTPQNETVIIDLALPFAPADAVR